MTPEAKEMIASIEQLGGIEVHRDEWHIAEELESEGVITLSHARGPGGDWRRAILVDHES